MAGDSGQAVVLQHSPSPPCCFWCRPRLWPRSRGAASSGNVLADNRDADLRTFSDKTGVSSMSADRVAKPNMDLSDELLQHHVSGESGESGEPVVFHLQRNFSDEFVRSHSGDSFCRQTSIVSIMSGKSGRSGRVDAHGQAINKNKSHRLTFADERDPNSSFVEQIEVPAFKGKGYTPQPKQRPLFSTKTARESKSGCNCTLM
eukprot:TRINITY_DN6344_c0_g1_i2.p1 TRINITY_DN6344_c0_g1~~TRINITY_DN6344_c0_g1_i2.p1  ORF type:complete len:203 (-),score=25.42 TRINITY_DN6344_c0_g1_i2:51-659(-)